MRTNTLSIALVLSAAFGAGLAACGSTDEEAPAISAGTAGAGGSPSAGTGAVGVAGSPVTASGGAGTGGSPGTAGGSGGTSGTGGTPQVGGQTSATGGAGASTGGSSAQSGAPGVAGMSGVAGTGGSSSSGCTGVWPTADPAVAGPLEIVTETNVGPAVGEGDDGGPPVAFTMFRPKELGQDGLCHPVVTWGNGTGSNPGLYKVLLGHLASHGFVVIASDSPQVAEGDPPPMVAGVTWVLEQNADPASALYQHIDIAHVGATGHSQGGFATTTAGGDEHVTTIAPLCGASSQRNLHGPAMLFCGGGDTTVPCSTVQRSYDAIENQPVMLAEYIEADHANWITFRGTTPSPVEIAVTAWMRVHLMGDTALRSWFYGPTCKLCTDAGWQISQKMMNE